MRILRIILVTVFSLLFLIGLFNLVNFGEQDFILNHPGYPSSSEFIKFEEKAKKQIILLTLFSLAILTLVAFGFKQKRKAD